MDSVIKRFKDKQKIKIFIRNPKICKKSIYVYKIVKENNENLYTNLIYKQSFQYKSRRFVFKKKEVYIYNKKYWELSIGNRSHSFTVYKVAEESIIGKTNLKVIKMCIPRGSKYFLGNNNQIISTDLICV